MGPLAQEGSRFRSVRRAPVFDVLVDDLQDRHVCVHIYRRDGWVAREHADRVFEVLGRLLRHRCQISPLVDPSGQMRNVCLRAARESLCARFHPAAEVCDGLLWRHRSARLALNQPVESFADGDHLQFLRPGEGEPASNCFDRGLWEQFDNGK